MKRFLAKLAFLHRVLWHRDPTYRTAVLLGPPPLLGCAVVAAMWLATHGSPVPGTAVEPSRAGGDVPWAHWTRPLPAAQGNEPESEEPRLPLPQPGPSGAFPGFEFGWQAAIQPMTVDASMETDVIATVLTRFTVDSATVPLERILDAGPPTGLFVGVEQSYLVVRRPGLYALSARLQRSATTSANCLMRLGMGAHRLIRSVNIGVGGDAVVDYRPVRLQLKAGLYPIGVAVGCWRGEQMNGSGTVTLLIQHPGEFAPLPAASGELLRPAARRG